MKLYIGEGLKPVKVTHLFKLQGDKHLGVPRAGPGDIVALAKIDELEVGAVLHDSHDEDPFHLPAMHFPEPIFGLGDYSLVGKDAEAQTVLQGQGELHLQIAIEKAHKLFHVDIDTENLPLLIERLSPPALRYAIAIRNNLAARVNLAK